MTAPDSTQESGEVLGEGPCKGLPLTVVLKQYESVCASYRGIDDFRAKLLALWPILGGAAGGVALLTSSTTNTGYLWAVGLFGFVVSVGIAVHEWAQTRRCGVLLGLAKRLEECLKLGVGTGQFKSIPDGFPASGKPLTLDMLEQRPATIDDSADWTSLKALRTYPVRTGVASVLVYGAVLVGWFCLFVWGVWLVLT
jgi:hypothetical protein